MTLRDELLGAQRDGVAIGHFNVSDLVLVKAVVAAARALDAPVLIGVSEGERELLGARELAALVNGLRQEHGGRIYLNADHTHSLVKAVEAAEAGFDMIVFDRSTLPLDENARRTADAVEVLKAINPEILVEGEIGDIGSGSEIHDQPLDPARGLTTAAEAKEFVERTGVDILAPAIGNMHGMLRSMADGHLRKHLRIDRIRQIRAATDVFLTLHGGSGTDDADLRAAIGAGITIVHINTELRIAWRRGLEASLAAHPSDLAPYKILPPVVDSVQQVVRARLALFNERHQPAA